MYLANAPGFNFKTYASNKHPFFNSLPPLEKLPIGPEHVTCQYMLNIVHIEEASYEGNDRVLSEWWHQLKLNTTDKQKQTGEEKVIVWVGDQLTVSRLRGLQKFRCNDLNSFERLVFLKEVFGWFHAQIAFEYSLHSQYYGTQLGFGLVHAFDLLKRKGLHSPTVEGAFHHHLKEGLLHISEARFRDLWSVVGKVDKLADLRSYTPEQLRALAVKIVDNHVSTAALQKMAANKTKKDELLYQSTQMARDLLDYVILDVAIKTGDVGCLQDLLPRLLFRFIRGKNKNYAIEILELFQGLHREWPPDLKNHIIKYCWLANTTGRQDGFEFLPIDLLQEHNVRDIKHTFAGKGPYGDWDYIGETSASIPCQRKVKDHVESDLNHFLRGKSHSSPEKEEDITRLYQASKIHSNHARRRLDLKDKVSDTMFIGVESSKLLKTMNKWVANRVSEWSSDEDWKDY